MSDFTNHEVLYMELMHTDKIDAAENLPGIITLSKKIVQIEKECGDAISRLEQETKEMIGLVGSPIQDLIYIPANVYNRSLTWFRFSRHVGRSKCPSHRTAWL